MTLGDYLFFKTSPSNGWEALSGQDGTTVNIFCSFQSTEVDFLTLFISSTGI